MKANEEKEFLRKLSEKGYKRYDPSAFEGSAVTDLYQKRFDDDTGKKYYINIKRWDFSIYRDRIGTADPVSFVYDVQLYKKNSHAAVDVEFFSDWTIEDVEEHVEWLFSSGRFDYYEKWNEYEC